MTLSPELMQDGYRSVPQPSKHVAAILRRIARGSILVTRREGKEHYSYDDGRVVLEASGKPLSAIAFSRMVREGWLIPINGESLLGGEEDAQRYRARQPSDGPLPTIRKGNGEALMIKYTDD